MNSSWFDKDVRPTYVAGENLTAGAVCVLDSTGELVNWTADASDVAALFFPLTDAKAGENVAVLVSGISPTTVLANAAAGTYTAGAPVYAAAGGTVADSGTRVVGIYLDEGVTLSAEGKLHIAHQYVPVVQASVPEDPEVPED